MGCRRWIVCALLICGCQPSANDAGDASLSSRGDQPPPIPSPDGSVGAPDVVMVELPDGAAPAIDGVAVIDSHLVPLVDAQAVRDVLPDDSAPVDTNPVADTGPPPVEARPPLPACGGSTTGQIDEWLVGQGNCSYPINELPAYAAAVDDQLYAAGAACGSCLEVSGQQGKVIATVVDRYPVSPGPNGDRISISEAALLKVAPPGTGVAALQWRWVPCPVQSPIMASLKDGSGQYYWEVALRNVVNRVVKVEYVVGTDLNWQSLPLSDYGFFRLESAKGLPSRLRLTDTAGTVLTTGVLQWPNNPVTAPISLDVQFPPTCQP
ncbi:MAG TPA: expansin EXLX1 family cellulose-binding protein [Polyangia bacterium]|jgi:expansin (peptidoglycan-binding protein)|nr:expansin EXLX1 family cellulose-binding protein [Polyangia bacterium]